MGDPSTSKPILKNIELYENYTSVHETWDRNSIIIDDVAAYFIAHEFVESDDIEPRSVDVNANVESFGLNGKMRSRLRWIL